MAKSSNIFARVEPELKEQVEQGLSDLASGKVTAAETVADRMRRDFGL